MGAFYGNITLKGPSQSQVVEALRGRRAIVSPSLEDLTVVFDSACDEQDVEEIEELTERLSRELNCAALAILVHDDDVFAYFLFQGGASVDSYNSCPSYFDFDSSDEPAGPEGGNPDLLCAAFAAGNPQEVGAILSRSGDTEGYVFETERHRDLVKALSLPEWTVGNAFERFERGEYPDVLLENQMLRAADPPPVEDEQLLEDRQFYDCLGPEDVSSPCRKEGCSRGSLLRSVFCRRHHFEMIQKRDCPFDH